LDNGEVEIDWRAHLHPSARPVVSTSAKELSSESSLTGAANNVPQAPATPIRRFFSDERKLAIVKETEQPGVTVSGIARKHGIVTGLLFRWRVEFGVAQKKRARLASVALADDTVATRFLQPPDGTTAVDPPDGRQVFATADSDPDVVRARVESGEIAP
jgi:transposase-like protein